MKLTELEPRWIHPDVFIFRCPHCREVWISCKKAVINSSDQFALFKVALGEDWNESVIPCNKTCAWRIDGTDFATLTVYPSIDASASGHWHGFITNGLAA